MILGGERTIPNLLKFNPKRHSLFTTNYKLNSNDAFIATIPKCLGNKIYIPSLYIRKLIKITFTSEFKIEYFPLFESSNHGSYEEHK